MNGGSIRKRKVSKVLTSEALEGPLGKTMSRGRYSEGSGDSPRWVTGK